MRIFEDTKTTKLLKNVAYAAIIGLIILDAIIPRHHVEFTWDKIPGFSSVYGFISAIAIILVAKVPCKRWLQKKEDYYD